jgi:hypothetical protein
VEAVKRAPKEPIVPSIDHSNALRLEKELVEMRRTTAASRQQLRNLQRDICSVHYNTQLTLDEISRTFATAHSEVVAKLADMDARNDTLSERLFEATKRLEIAAARVDQAVSIRATFEAECAVLKNAIDVAKSQLSELDVEASELDAAERDLRDELSKLDLAKKSGVLNLEDARERNAVEEHELEVEESRLATSNHQLAVLRGKIADLKRAQMAIDTR